MTEQKNAGARIGDKPTDIHIDPDKKPTDVAQKDDVEGGAAGATQVASAAAVTDQEQADKQRKAAEKKAGKDSRPRSTDVDQTSSDLELEQKEQSKRLRDPRDSALDDAPGGSRATDVVEGEEDAPEYLTAEGATFTVKDGQVDIGDVARYLGIRADDLADINGKTGGRVGVVPGEKIKLPVGYKKATEA